MYYNIFALVLIHGGQKLEFHKVKLNNDFKIQIVQYKNFIGIQFHPEKSGEDGLAILNQALKGGFL